VAEELIAEMSAAYLCAEAGISPAVVENQAAYIQGWLSRLKSEKRLIVVAAAKAQRTADYILGRSSTE
jgi:antirestriction protein ArdC